MLVACRAPRLDPEQVKDACAYLTKAEAESVLERPAWRGRRSGELGYSVCSYRAVFAPEYAVVLLWHLGGGVADFESVQEKALKARGAIVVDRIGDDAFWIPDPRPTPESAGTLWVRKGRQIFKVTAGQGHGDPPWKAARELARDVLRRF
jgi:hypothetical protein